jgi:hypothetical protein
MNRDYYLVRDGRNKKNRIINILIVEIPIIGIIYLVGKLIPILFK